MLFYILNPLINALIATILSFVVYFRNRKQLVNKVFALFSAVVAVWSYAYFVWFLLKDKNLILLNHRIFLMGASIFIAILFFHSILAFTNKNTRQLRTGEELHLWLLTNSKYSCKVSTVQRKMIFRF